jgi:hypothetical protein
MAKSPAFPELDPGHKRTTWETIVITTPVILTVMATILAGLSSSEMSSAQYYRSLAAQMQSKVSDQWGYFQAKKLRAEQCGNTIEILRTVSQSMPMKATDLYPTVGQLLKQMQRVANTVSASELNEEHRGSALSVASEQVSTLLSKLQSAEGISGGGDAAADFMRADIPDISESAIDNPQIAQAMDAVNSHVPEPDLEREAGQIPQDQLDHAITIANENAAAFDKAVAQMTSSRSQTEQTLEGISQAVTNFERAAQQATEDVVAKEPADSTLAIHEISSQLATAVSVAGLKFNSNRYQREAYYNQVLAELLEIQVRRQGFSSDRYRIRSKEFFYGMLGAQAGVTIATFSLAVRRRNLLWGLAASAGLAAVTFAAYVYMFV